MPHFENRTSLRPPFRDRRHAGHSLAHLVGHLRGSDPIVLALPRGGVPVAAVVAEALAAALDVIVVRKLAMPSAPEFALGAITWDSIRAVNPSIAVALGASEDDVDRSAVIEARELERRTRVYRKHRPLPDVRGRTVLLVDDGVATGATALAAITWIRRQVPRRLVLAVPVIAASTARELRGSVDELIAIYTPEDLGAVGAWYDDFEQVSDEEVVRLLA